MEKSRRQQKQLREMSHQVLQAQEEERKRISRELHDVIAQSLVGINIHLAALSNEGRGTLRGIQQKITRTRRLVEKSVETIHRFALELRPTVLDDLGLIPALHAHLTRFMAETGIRASLKAYAGIEKAPAEVRTTLFRIAQESLTNVARHACASQVTVSLENTRTLIRMKITDDGRGFNPDDTVSSPTRNRIGLLGIRERVEMTGGALRIDSAPGRSTTIIVEIKKHTPPSPARP